MIGWFSDLGFFCFVLVGFHHRFLLILVRLADFGFMLLGDHFVRGIGDLSLGPSGCGPYFFDGAGLDMPFFLP